MPAEAGSSLERLPPIESTESFEQAPEIEPIAEGVEIDVNLDPQWLDLPWYRPRAWVTTRLWTPSLELGFNNSSGNTETLSLRVGASAKRETKRSVLDFDLNYTRAHANSVETENQALANTRHEWLFADSPWTLFWHGGLEYDEFKAFDLRLATDAGVGYRLIDTKTANVTGRFGSGVSHEIDSPDDRYVPEAVFGADFEWQLSKAQKMDINVEYRPDWSDFEEYRIVAGAGWEVILSADNNLSLKLSVIDRYDSTPNGRKPNDLNTALLLIWTP